MLTLISPMLSSATERDSIASLIEKAEAYGESLNGKVFRDSVDPNWSENGSRFWYRIETSSDKFEYVLIDPETETREVLFDPEQLANFLEEQSKEKIDTRPLPFAELKYQDSDDTVSFVWKGKQWNYHRADNRLEASEIKPASLKAFRNRSGPKKSPSSSTRTEIVFENRTDLTLDLYWVNQSGKQVSYGTLAPGETRSQSTYTGHVWQVANESRWPLATFRAREGLGYAAITLEDESQEDASLSKPRNQGLSPNGEWIATIKDGNVTLKKVSIDSTQVLTTDGDSTDGYAFKASWAPDSSSFVVTRVRSEPKRQIEIVETAPDDQLQPKTHTIDYIKPGDPLPVSAPVLFSIDDPRPKPVDLSAYGSAFNTSGLIEYTWAPDSSEIYLNFNQRGHQNYYILAINAETAEIREIVAESSNTFIDWTEKTWRKWLPDTGELIWTSERDGWNHLYLYDTTTGSVKNRITAGEWVVRAVKHVDVEQRRIWFMANGLREKEDPYFQHLCSINFDDSDFRILTEGSGTHSVEFSPDKTHFLDTWSRIDQPPVTELRRSDDGSLIKTLETAEWSELLETGWTIPEPFVAKGRDGKTDIYGIIVKPSHFDPGKRYPVVEEIYAGPHSAFVPKAFNPLKRLHSIAELGFIVVRIDGMGTDHRGKEFHKIAWKNLKDSGFPDRIAWMKAAAETRSWMDLSRVGIYGGSAGGQSAMRAVLDHADFYKTAVADCGCHDNRMDKIWWNEQWLGWPLDESYVENSNVEHAHRLGGNLLLVVGEMDMNVDPASTYQVVDALIKADKDFEFLPIPGAGHGAAETPYGKKRRMQFLAKHLLNFDP